MASFEENITFLAKQRPLLRKLFEAQYTKQKTPEDIPQAQLESMLEHTSKQAITRLQDFLKEPLAHPRNGLHEELYEFISYLMDKQELGLTGVLRGYAQDIQELWKSIEAQQSAPPSPHRQTLLLDLISKLGRVIGKLVAAMKRNTRALLQQVQELNRHQAGPKASPAYKLELVAQWTESYVKPLNKLLARSEDSLSARLDRIELAVNMQLDTSDKLLRAQRVELALRLSWARGQLALQAEILGEQISPLLRQLKKESRALIAMAYYLQLPHAARPTGPALIERRSRLAFPKDLTALTEKALKDAQPPTPQLLALPATAPTPPWYFDKKRYRALLAQALPVEDFFFWIYRLLKKEVGAPTARQYLIASNLWQQPACRLTFGGPHRPLQMQDAIIQVPLLHICRL